MKNIKVKNFTYCKILVVITERTLYKVYTNLYYRQHDKTLCHKIFVTNPVQQLSQKFKRYRND